MTERRLLSVVTICYNEGQNVCECREAVRRVFAESLPEYDYEHIFCDNASSDDTVALLREMAAADPRVKLILNARDVGPFRSVFNGILSTRGEGVLACLPADLQDPVELLPEFVRRWEAGYEVVYGVRRQREESPLMAGVRRAFYRLVSGLSEIDIPENVGEFQFIDRRVVENLRRMEDHYPYVRGMIAYCGFRRTGLEYVWKARRRGFSKNRLVNLIDMALNGIVSFSRRPPRLALAGGLALAGLGLGAAGLQFAAGLLGGRLAPTGLTALTDALFVLAGVQLFFLGLLGEYITAIHCQVRKRPLVVERERVNF